MFCKWNVWWMFSFQSVSYHQGRLSATLRSILHPHTIQLSASGIDYVCIKMCCDPTNNNKLHLACLAAQPTIMFVPASHQYCTKLFKCLISIEYSDSPTDAERTMSLHCSHVWKNLCKLIFEDKLRVVIGEGDMWGVIMRRGSQHKCKKWAWRAAAGWPGLAWPPPPTHQPCYENRSGRRTAKENKARQEGSS